MTLDLLAEALADPAPRRIGGYTDLGPSLSVNVTSGFSLLLTPQPAALRIESGLPPWLSLEGWLPDRPATACRLDLTLLAERDCAASAFLRVIGADGCGIDGPAQGLRPGSGAACVDLPLDPGDGRRRKVVLLIERPPAVILLRRLALSLEGGP